MTSLIDLRTKMSEPMYWEVHQMICETRDGKAPTIEQHTVRADGFDDAGRYFGSLARGERMYRIDTDFKVYYVRTTATLAQLRSVFSR